MMTPYRTEQRARQAALRTRGFTPEERSDRREARRRVRVAAHCRIRGEPVAVPTRATPRVLSAVCASCADEERRFGMVEAMRRARRR